MLLITKFYELFAFFIIIIKNGLKWGAIRCFNITIKSKIKWINLTLKIIDLNSTTLLKRKIGKWEIKKRVFYLKH